MIGITSTVSRRRSCRRDGIIGILNSVSRDAWYTGSQGLTQPGPIMPLNFFFFFLPRGFDPFLLIASCVEAMETRPTLSSLETEVARIPRCLLPRVLEDFGYKARLAYEPSSDQLPEIFSSFLFDRSFPLRQARRQIVSSSFRVLSFF